MCGSRLEIPLAVRSGKITQCVSAPRVQRLFAIPDWIRVPPPGTVIVVSADLPATILLYEFRHRG